MSDRAYLRQAGLYKSENGYRRHRGVSFRLEAADDGRATGEIMFVSNALARRALASAIFAALSGHAFAQDDI